VPGCDMHDSDGIVRSDSESPFDIMPPARGNPRPIRHFMCFYARRLNGAGPADNLLTMGG
jgi:hypothetical protein